MIINNFLNILNSFNKKYDTKLSLSEFSRLTGISLHIASNLYHDRTKSISYDTLDKLVKFFELPPSAFLKYYNGHLTFKLSNAKIMNPSKLMLHDEDVHPAVLLSCDGYNPIFLIMPEKPFNYYDHFDKQYRLDVPLFYTNVGKYSIDIQSKIDKYMIRVINSFSDRFQRYIISRIMLHGGIIPKSKQFNKYSIYTTNNMDYSTKIKVTSSYINLGGAFFKSDKDLMLYKNQPKRNKHRVLKSNSKPIKLYDYTTNNFAK